MLKKIQTNRLEDGHLNQILLQDQIMLILELRVGQERWIAVK